MSNPAVTLMERANQARRERRLADAHRDFVEAVALCRHKEMQRELAQALKGLAQIERDSGRPDLAEPCYDEALAPYRSSERIAPLDLANAIRPLAILKEGAGDLEEARHLWAEARDLYATAEVGEGVDECSARLKGLGS